MTGITKWKPFRSLARRDDLFDDLFRDSMRSGERDPGLLEPAADVAESAGELTVKLEVPGVEKENVHVTVDENSITVRGESRQEKEEKKKDYYRREIRYGAFQRTIPLPTEIDPAKTAAKLDNGMLTITLPKLAQARAKRLEVAVK